MNVRIGKYGDYSSGNYGTNAMRVEVGPVTLYFSYQTLVAFNAPGFDSVVSENSWGSTTGKHLNWIDGGDKKNRLPSDAFDAEVSKLLKKFSFPEIIME